MLDDDGNQVMLMLTFERVFGRRTARYSLGLRCFGRKGMLEVSHEALSTAESEMQDLLSNGFDDEEPELVEELATEE